MAGSTCSGCGEVFNSDGAFTQHRVGGYSRQMYAEGANGQQSRRVIGRTPSTRRCLTVDELVDRGWLKNARGRWIVERYDRPVFGVSVAMEDLSA